MCAGSTFRWIHLTYDIIFPIKLWDCSYQLQVCRLNDLWGSSVNSGKSFQFSKWNIHGNLNDGETFTKLIIIHPPINKTVWARFWLTNLNINFSFAKKSVYLCLRVAEFAFEAAHGEESVRMILAISIKFASLMFETKVERERESEKPEQITLHWPWKVVVHLETLPFHRIAEKKTEWNLKFQLLKFDFKFIHRKSKQICSEASSLTISRGRIP